MESRERAANLPLIFFWRSGAPRDLSRCKLNLHGNPLTRKTCSQDDEHPLGAFAFSASPANRFAGFTHGIREFFSPGPSLHDVQRGRFADSTQPYITSSRTTFPAMSWSAESRAAQRSIIALALKELKSERPVWVFDTFEGIPAATTDDPDYEIASLTRARFAVP